MAAILIGCGVLLSDRISDYRRARKDRKRAAAVGESFEDLKEMNAKRMSCTVKANKEHDPPPPSYEEAVGVQERRRASATMVREEEVVDTRGGDWCFGDETKKAQMWQMGQELWKGSLFRLGMVQGCAI
ncbi:hypothetical protein LTR66_007040 [Elasticomyces elasticus]|nr:hypothetical protein LTR66_007040 [Elasticomyces elasticus]